MKNRAMQHFKTIPDGDGVRKVELSALNVRVPESLMRSVRRRATLDGKTLGDFVREAIEERFRGPA